MRLRQEAEDEILEDHSLLPISQVVKSVDKFLQSDNKINDRMKRIYVDFHCLSKR